MSAGSSVIAYSLNGSAVKDSWKTIVVIHNPNLTAVSVTLPAKADWKIVVKGTAAGLKVLGTLKGATKVSVEATSTLVLEN